MARIAPTLLVLALLAATAAAFVVTEALKLRPSPISGVRVDPKVVSPAARSRTTISFRLRSQSRITVQIVSGDHVVRTLVDAKKRPRGRLTLTWNGRGDAGQSLPDGPYAVRVEFPHGHLRRIQLPNPLSVDTRAPRVLHASVQPRTISPDGDDHADRAHLVYTLSEVARGIVFVDGRQLITGRLPDVQGELNWNGRIGGRVVPGTHLLSLAAVDPAGNIGKPVAIGRVVVRFVTLGRQRIVVAAGGRIQLTVSSDRPSLRWQLGARQGRVHGHVFRLRAPQKPGRYRLRIGYDTHIAVATVIVR